MYAHARHCNTCFSALCVCSRRLVCAVDTLTNPPTHTQDGKGLTRSLGAQYTATHCISALHTGRQGANTLCRRAIYCNTLHQRAVCLRVCLCRGLVRVVDILTHPPYTQGDKGLTRSAVRAYELYNDAAAGL